MINASSTNRFIFFLSLLGLSITVFLAYEYSLSTSITCPVGGSECEAVRASVYSKFLGIPIPYLGIAFYLSMALLAIYRTVNLANNLFTRLQFLGAFSGFMFGLYLTYLETFVIRAYCFWCVTSFMISIIILSLSIVCLKTNFDEN